MLQQLANGLSLGAIYALVAVGFSIVFNVLKLVNFAHGGMLLFGAYAGFYLLKWTGMPIWAAIIASSLLAGVLSGLTERLILRPLRRRQAPLVYFFVASITVFTLLENVISAATGANVMAYPNTGFRRMISIGDVRLATTDLLILVVTVVSLWLTVVLLYRTKVGLGIRAAAYDPRAASLMGVNLDLVVSAAFVLAGVLAGLGGVFLGINYAVYPSVGKMVYKAFTACMIGGLGSLPGAVIGAIFFGLTETLLIAYVSSALASTFTFGFLILFLLVRPRGIMGVVIEEKV